MTPEERFDALVRELATVEGVTAPVPGGGFGSATLRYHRKIFAMLVGGRLVVKLPSFRVDGLVDDGEGERFDGGKGRPMKEWFSLDPASSRGWRALADEAREFVAPRG